MLAVHSVNSRAHAQRLLNGDWDQADPCPIDLVITDWVMPDGGGQELIRYIRSSPVLSTTPIIVFTGADNPQDISTAYKIGANTVAQKPMDIDDFQSSIQLILKYWLLVATLPREIARADSSSAKNIPATT